jgi:hypothetical protein
VGLDKIAERAIREAMLEGKFDQLPNQGQPLDLEDYFKVPEEWRAAYGLLKSARVLPEEAELLKEIDQLGRDIEAARSPKTQDALRKTLQSRRTALAILLERRRTSRR